MHFQPAFPLRTTIVHHPRTSPGGRLLGIGLGLLVTLVGAWAGLHQHAQVRTGMDLAIFDQAVRALSRGAVPSSAIKTPGMNLWGDHFHPAIIVWVPLYWLWDDPRMLIGAQAACVGGGTTVLVRTALRVLPGRIPRGWVLPGATVVGLAFAMSLGVQTALTFDVHEVSLAVVPLSLCLAALVERRPTAACWWALSLLPVKEDMGVLVVGIAVVMAVTGFMRQALLLAVTSAVWTWLVVTVVIPSLHPDGVWSYASTVAGSDQVVRNLWASVGDPGDLRTAIGCLLLAGAFLALRSPVVLAAVPVLAARTISSNTNHWGIGHHYNLLPAVVVAFASLDGMVRLRRGWVRVVALLAIVPVTILTAFRGPLVRAIGDGTISASPHLVAARMALSRVPGGVPIATDVQLTPHVGRDHAVVQQIEPPDLVDHLGHPLVADWWILDRCSPSYGGATRWVPRVVDTLRSRGFSVLSDEGCFVVFTR